MAALSADEMKAMTRQFVDELYNKGNTAIVNKMLAPNFVYHNATPPITRDREGVIQEAMMARAAFPDLRIEVDDLFVEGDKGVMRYTLRGTHEGDLMGIPPTHKRITWSGVNIAQSVDGVYTDWWNYVDMLGFFQQLGAFPPMLIAPQPEASQSQPQM